METQGLLEIDPNLTLLITVLYFNEFIRYESSRYYKYH